MWVFFVALNVCNDHLSPSYHYTSYCCCLRRRYDYLEGEVYILLSHLITEISAKNLGIKVEVFDEAGRNIEGTGEPGELVCTRPHPTIPLYFWGDKDGNLLKKTYFDKYPGQLIKLSRLGQEDSISTRDLETRRLRLSQSKNKRILCSRSKVR